MAATLQHPELGSITGCKGDGVNQYLGVQYATIKDRFSEPILRTDYGGEITSTKVGYVSCLYPNSSAQIHQDGICTDLAMSSIDLLATAHLTASRMRQSSTYKKMSLSQTVSLIQTWTA
jgi:hypothetical protein